MKTEEVLEEVEVTLGDTGEVAVYKVTTGLAERAASVLREWMRTKGEELMLRRFALLAEELRRESASTAAPAEVLGGESARVAARALYDVVNAKCFTPDEQKALAVAQRDCWRMSRRKDREVSISLSHAQFMRVVAAFRALGKTSDFALFDHDFCVLYTEVFGPLHDASKYKALFDSGLHALSPVEFKKFKRSFSVQKPDSLDVRAAIGKSLRDPCADCSYVHVACFPPGGGRPDKRCECPCHAPLLRSTGGDA